MTLGSNHFPLAAASRRGRGGRALCAGDLPCSLSLPLLCVGDPPLSRRRRWPPWPPSPCPPSPLAPLATAATAFPLHRCYWSALLRLLLLAGGIRRGQPPPVPVAVGEGGGGHRRRSLFQSRAEEGDDSELEDSE
ncbi:hypothetical protein Taro_040858, partial [Colocasia esculenta]|nr:hypothetical protein [Colocasia esculenta]